MKLDLSGYSVKTLTVEDSDTLQDLYERCVDYFDLIEGQSPAPTAAKDEFSALPKGRGLDDKFMFGLFREEALVGLLESVRHYPDEKTWWLGLFMLEPNSRGRGVGAAFYEAFERFVTEQGAVQTMLSVAEENTQGLRFWRGLGFEEVRRTEPRAFGGKTHVFVVMKRDIGSTSAPRRR